MANVVRGEVAITPQFQIASPFSDGLARVWDGRFWRFIDKTGRFASPEKFVSTSPFVNGTAKVVVPGPLDFLAATRNTYDTRATFDHFKKNWNEH